MKNTVVIESATTKQIDALLAFLKELGIKATVTNTEYSEDMHALSIVSEPSLAEAWDSKEDERWDELYHAKK
ncbi:MAG TPA: hypothetical protein VGB95_05050 [Chitinophagales bacterium]